MPYNHSKLELRLSACDTKLQALFDESELSETIKQKIKYIQDYYNLSYTKAGSAKTVEKIASQYELFVTQLSKVKNGDLKPKEALESIESNLQSRKLSIVFHNLAKACELVFWAAVTFSLYSGIWGIALPVIIIQPVLGVALAVTFAGAMLAAAYKGLSCCTDFKSFTRHDVECIKETDLVSFFRPAPQKHIEHSLLTEERDDHVTHTC